MTRHFLSFLVLSLTGCGLLSMPEKMDEVGKSTDRVASDTQILSNKTSDVLEESKKLAQLTAMLLKASRQAVAQEQRVRAQQEFTRKDAAFEIATKNAAVYFRGFEFQLWENTWYDTEAGREALFATGAEEFFIYLRGLVGKRERLDPFSVQNNLKARSLYSLAATMEQINDLQVESSFRNSFQPVSMLDLVVSSLRQRARLDEFPNVGPKYAEKILQYEDEALYILQLRYSAFLLILADKLLDLSQMGLFDQFLATSGWRSQTADLSKLNAMELKELLYKYAYGALYVRNVLKELGHPLRFGGQLDKLPIEVILAELKFKDDPSAASGKRAFSASLKRALSQIFCETTACEWLSKTEIESVVTSVEYRAEAPFTPGYATQADTWMKLQIDRRMNQALRTELENEGKRDYRELLGEGKNNSVH